MQGSPSSAPQVATASVHTLSQPLAPHSRATRTPPHLDVPRHRVLAHAALHPRLLQLQAHLKAGARRVRHVECMEFQQPTGNK